MPSSLAEQSPLEAPAGFSILVARDGELLEPLRPLTQRHLVREILLAGTQSTAARLAGALEEARAGLGHDGILMLTVIDAGFAWEGVVAAALAKVSDGLRVFGLSTGRPWANQPPPSAASVAWIAWPGERHTQFLEAVVRVWAKGAYAGGTADFVSDLGTALGPSELPILVTAGKPNPAFLRQRPFTVSPPPAATVEPLVGDLASAIRAGKELRVHYRDAAGKASDFRLLPLLLGSSDGNWRVWGFGYPNALCLQVDRILLMEESKARPDHVPLAGGHDHFQHCIKLVDVWVPRRQPV
ncbi:MAG: WYL domain-containing protein [Candidatus Dormibacteraeota bacterium]|nr:WYL domain-containing protein [Candidatus Dormibacteraeota bacterium]